MEELYSIEDVIFFSQPVYSINLDFNKFSLFQKRIIIPSYNPHVFEIVGIKRKSMIGEYFIFTIIQKEVKSSYKIHVSITTNSGESCTEIVTNLHPTTRPMQLPDRVFVFKLIFEHLPTIQETRSLADDLKPHFDEGPFIILIGSDGEISVSKLALQLRSSVLKAMFTHDMEENRTLTIDLKDFKCITLQAFCNFLSTDSTEVNNETGLELYELADKYDIQRLKKLTEEYILTNLEDFDRNEVFKILIKTNDQLFNQLLIEKYSVIKN